MGCGKNFTRNADTVQVASGKQKVVWRPCFQYVYCQCPCMQHDSCYCPAGSKSPTVSVLAYTHLLPCVCLQCGAGAPAFDVAASLVSLLASHSHFAAPAFGVVFASVADQLNTFQPVMAGHQQQRQICKLQLLQPVVDC